MNNMEYDSKFQSLINMRFSRFLDEAIGSSEGEQEDRPAQRRRRGSDDDDGVG